MGRGGPGGLGPGGLGPGRAAFAAMAAAAAAGTPLAGCAPGVPSGPAGAPGTLYVVDPGITVVRVDPQTGRPVGGPLPGGRWRGRTAACSSSRRRSGATLMRPRPPRATHQVDIWCMWAQNARGTLASGCSSLP
jgi:hypothetical protein